MSDKELINICLEEISHKLGHDDPGSLRQRDIEHLCAEIEKRTGILISLSTIKRLLNGQYNRLPQTATLNAITAYLGYQSWQDFKVKNQGLRQSQPDSLRQPFDELRVMKPDGLTVESENQQSVDLQGVSLSLSKTGLKKGWRWLSYKTVVLGVAVTLLLMMVSLKYFSRTASFSEKDASFSVKKITSNDIPNTVVFSYDLSKADGDSFFIQQSWDTDRRVRIDKNKNTLTDIYYEPGYHNAKLIVNDKVVKTIDVSIPTNGWFFYSKQAMFKGLPTYIHPASAVKDGVLALSTEDLISNKIDTLHENAYAYTFFPEKFDAGSDNFSFKTRIRFKEIRNVKCPVIMHEVFGQSNSLFFFTTLPGCTGNIDARIGEHYLSGKTNDLSAFGCDVRQWHDMEVVVKNKEAKIYIDQKEVFSKTYTKSPGLITGLTFMSNGLCEIDNIELKGLDGKIVYQNDFNE